MRISVLIATYQRAALLQRTLPTVLEQRFPRDQFEVLVLVDGSTDGTVDYLTGITSAAHLRVIDLPHAGQAAALNAGLQLARGDIILFLDDDILCGPEVVAAHATVPRTGNRRLAFGPVLLADDYADPLAAAWARTYCDEFFQNLDAASAADGWFGCMASANSSALRSDLLECGGLDSKFERGQDRDLGTRLRHAGLEFAYCRSAVTHQVFTKTRHDLVAEAQGEAVGELALCRKHPGVRHCSGIAATWTSPSLKRATANLVCALPVSPEPLLRPLTAATWLFQRNRTMRRAALRLFGWQQTIVWCRETSRLAGSTAALRREFGVRLPVLMYHAVGPLRRGAHPDLAISPITFERHVRFLARHGYRTIRVADWIAWRTQGAPLPEKPILITFDDAFADTAEHAFPLLEEHGFTGTVLVPTGHVGGTNAWDRPSGLGEFPLMTVDQMRSWAARGFEFGAHGRTHADLRTLPEDTRTDELRGSRDDVTRMTGTEPLAVAYPYGHHDPDTVETARRYFSVGLTCDPGLNDVRTDLLRMKRATVVSRFPWADAWAYVTLGFNPLWVARTQARKLLRRTPSSAAAPGSRAHPERS